MKQDQPIAHSDYGSIAIRGALENNLRNVSLDIPKRRITVFTGESQRLIETTYPAFVQQFMPHYGQPECQYAGKHLGGHHRWPAKAA